MVVMSKDVLLFMRLSCKHKFEKALELKTQQVKQELIMRANLRVQGFVSGGNFSFTQCHNFLRIVNL